MDENLNVPYKDSRPPVPRPRSSSESGDGQLAHFWPDVRGDRHHRHHHGEGAAQQGEETL